MAPSLFERQAVWKKLKDYMAEHPDEILNAHHVTDMYKIAFSSARKALQKLNREENCIYIAAWERPANSGYNVPQYKWKSKAGYRDAIQPPIEPRDDSWRARAIRRKTNLERQRMDKLRREHEEIERQAKASLNNTPRLGVWGL